MATNGTGPDRHASVLFRRWTLAPRKQRLFKRLRGHSVDRVVLLGHELDPRQPSRERARPEGLKRPRRPVLRSQRTEGVLEFAESERAPLVDAAFEGRDSNEHQQSLAESGALA